MQRFISKKVSIRSRSRHATSAGPEKVDTSAYAQNTVHAGSKSTSTLINSDPRIPPPPLNLNVLRIDYYYDTKQRIWTYRDTAAIVYDDNNPWNNCCFVVLRKVPQDYSEPTFQIVVKNLYLRHACKEVIQKMEGVSWTAELLELDPQLLVTFYSHFQSYEEKLRAKHDRSLEESNTLSSVQVLMDYLRKDYRDTFSTVASLTEHGEITFDILYAIFVPRTIVLTECRITSEIRALRIKSVSTNGWKGAPTFSIFCESVNVFDDLQSEGGQGRLGITEETIVISSFKGAIKITSLTAYPIHFHPDEQGVRSALIVRGRKWLSLTGMHHMDYNGTATSPQPKDQYDTRGRNHMKDTVDSRIMIDQSHTRRIIITKIRHHRQTIPSPMIGYPDTCPAGVREVVSLLLRPITQLAESLNKPLAETVTEKLQVESTETDVSDEYLLFAPTVLYGFSFEDKKWFTFNVENVTSVTWDEESFTNLVLPDNRKMLLQSLVEAHTSGIGFDDFVKGKGHGLIINLYGPPGVGKTLSAEATSEHVKRPLYVVGGGDLGTNAHDLDHNLKRIFDIASRWKAILLIDEADVFLEARALDDLERNAMVAVFLRHIEYYRGILFLTTNRVKTFDPAFLSRMHLALHFHDLPKSAKAQLWCAFLKKAGLRDDELNGEMLGELSEWSVNGRQIKNATRTAQSLAMSRGERLGVSHVSATLHAMEEFASEFAAMN